MIQIDVMQILALMSIPSAVTGFCFWLVQRNINKRDKERAAAAAERQKKAEEREKAREELEFALIQGNWAAIALAEATARAVQRIPDANCNGEMHAALAYAEKVKHEQKDFLARQGVHALVE